MSKKEIKINEQTKEFFDSIKFINDKDLGDLNFYEACLYLEKFTIDLNGCL